MFSGTSSKLHSNLLLILGNNRVLLFVTNKSKANSMLPLEEVNLFNQKELSIDSILVFLQRPIHSYKLQILNMKSTGKSPSLWSSGIDLLHPEISQFVSSSNFQSLVFYFLFFIFYFLFFIFYFCYFIYYFLF